MSDSITSRTKARPLSTLQVLDLADTAYDAWTRGNQLFLILQALRHRSTAGLDIPPNELEATEALADDLRDELISIRRMLGATPEEVAL